MNDIVPKLCMAPNRQYKLRCAMPFGLMHFAHVAKNKQGEFLLSWWNDPEMEHLPAIKWPALPHDCDNKCMCFALECGCDYCKTVMTKNGVLT